MKNYIQLFLVSLISVFFLSSCEVIGDIFQAGMWVGVLLVVVVVVGLIWLVSKFRGRK